MPSRTIIHRFTWEGQKPSVVKDKPQGKWAVVINVQFREEGQVPSDRMQRHLRNAKGNKEIIFLPTKLPRPEMQYFTCMAAQKWPEPIPEMMSAVIYLSASDGEILPFPVLSPPRPQEKHWPASARKSEHGVHRKNQQAKLMMYFTVTNITTIKKKKNQQTAQMPRTRQTAR